MIQSRKKFELRKGFFFSVRSRGRGIRGRSDKPSRESAKKIPKTKRRKKEKPKEALQTYRSRPSKLAHELVRASYGTPARSTIVSGRMMGRKESVCAQMAVTRMTGLSGWQSEPPAARLYAVEPVGVAMHTPSAWMLVKCSSSPKSSIEDIAFRREKSQSRGVEGELGGQAGRAGSRTCIRASIDNDFVEDVVRAVRPVRELVITGFAN